MPDFTHENIFQGNVCGVDEVGRGSFAGPVIACAVIFKDKNIPNDIINNIDDSKKINKKKRELLYSAIIKYCDYAIGFATVEEIDKLNILQATLVAMKRAINKLDINIEMALIDGNIAPYIDINYKLIIKGDSKSISIATASIIAKIYRDKLMFDLSQYYPHYKWDKNSGYGTKQHIEAIKQYGITKHHRKSFAPIKKTLDV